MAAPGGHHVSGKDFPMERNEEFLKSEIKRLQKEIKELRVRMPPHDPTMAMMMEMDELEVEQDDLRAELKALLEK